MCRDKLLRLRSLYMSQFERLKHVYKNKRRKYLLATAANEEDLTGNLLLQYFNRDSFVSKGNSKELDINCFAICETR